MMSRLANLVSHLSFINCYYVVHNSLDLLVSFTTLFLSILTLVKYTFIFKKENTSLQNMQIPPLEIFKKKISEFTDQYFRAVVKIREGRLSCPAALARNLSVHAQFAYRAVY